MKAADALEFNSDVGSFILDTLSRTPGDCSARLLLPEVGQNGQQCGNEDVDPLSNLVSILTHVLTGGRRWWKRVAVTWVGPIYGFDGNDRGRPRTESTDSLDPIGNILTHLGGFDVNASSVIMYDRQ
jgi:hypothetical protein